jgi:polysaccharide biosynthesis transport protein
MDQHRMDRENGEAGGSGFSLERAIAALRRRWRLAAVVPAAAVLVATLVAVVLPDRFEASAVIQIDPRKKTISNIEGVLSELKADAATVDSEVEVIRSRAVTLKVIDILDVRSDPEFAQSSFWRRMGLTRGERRTRGPADAAANVPTGGIRGPASPGSTQPERDEVAAAFAERLKVGRVRNTLLIDIRFSASDPVKAARIANTVAEVYLAEQLAAKQRAAGVATGLLEEKLEELRKKLAVSERKVEQFKAANDIFDSEGQILSEKQLARLMEQTVMARNTTAEARAKYEQAQRLKAKGESSGAIADVLQSHTVRLMKEQLANATRREAELLTKYGARHPEMQKVRAEVADAEGQLAAEVTRLVANLRNEFEVAQAREEQLAKGLELLKQEQVLSREAGVQLKELEREAATSRQLFEALLARYKQTAETQGLQLPDARLVEQADVPLTPAAPKRKQIVLLAALGGLLGGIALILVLEFATSGLGRPEDVEQAFELAHLASLPKLVEPDRQDPDPLRHVRRILAEPRGAFSEAVRAARREIDVRRRDRGPRVILVAGSLPGEGASVVASNLAHHYAVTGERVLLIDADLRRAALTRQLAPAVAAGLAEVLAGFLPPEQAILRDGGTGLHFLPAGAGCPVQASPPEMLASTRMTEMLVALRRRFDTIVIDAPPLLPVIDARILADLADQIVFAMAWRSTPKPLARRALTLLGFNQEKLVGVVVNRVDPAVIEHGCGISAMRASSHAVPELRAA